MSLAPGEEFAGYTITHQLGSGAMGEVYLVQHPRLPRQEALKILRAEIANDDNFRQRFIREADSIAALEHPNIVTVHDRGETDNKLWISTQYVDGTDAARLLQSRYPAGMPADEVAEIATAIGGALDYAHGQGLLHRDVKPANILLGQPDQDGHRRIYLADFGIALPLDDPAGLTATNFALGTLAYAAPEQLMGKPIDGRADQYALAATAYHLLTGRPLYPDTNPVAVISQHLTQPPPPPSTLRPELAPFDAAFARALAKQPRDRFPSCQDFAHALTAATTAAGGYSASAPTQEAPTPPPPRPPTAGPAGGAARAHPIPRGLAAITAAATIGGIAAAALFWHPWTTKPAPVTTPPTTTITATPAPTPISVAPAPQEPTVAAPPEAAGIRYAIPACYGFDKERPTTLQVRFCADGSAKLSGLSWTSWGAAGAEGRGYYSERTCNPSCAEGGEVTYPIYIHATNPAPLQGSGCASDMEFYSQVTLAFPGDIPPGQPLTNSQYKGLPAALFTISGKQNLGAPVCQ